ncbi:uncharacterized protein LOC110039289 [Phalaenopsis equestris]|uniref:uncharacterized protein LOC110039289 n=1 Tax=Phalaenopsis equestris TaxID=78828 RepID=UPI0009E3B577|nr:uncharacterized protein LOC110039289 [Phalaenopsis equestris]
MEEKVAENAFLDYASFHVSWPRNSYEALICSNGVIEKLDSGPLDQLAMHLPEVRASRSNPLDGSFKLQLDPSNEFSSWFSKFTLTSFLHVVKVPNVLKFANEIVNEICHLEETRRFHIALYAKGNSNHYGGGTTEVSYLDDAGLTQQVKVDAASSDATKNDLLRALDLRLTALKEELVASFNLAPGATCCANQVRDLQSFAQHFGAVQLSNLLLKLLELCPNNLHFDTAMKQQTTSLSYPERINQTSIGSFSLLSAKLDVVKPAAGVSPVKVAQAERQNSSDTEDSSDSSDKDNPSGDRCRPVLRSVAPRRSASPMRRIQIGRSGSRRSTAIAIKSLNYFPDREKTMSNRDADLVTVDNEMEHLPKKPENNATRMSVQDAISLFERKQKVENADIQNRKTSDLSISANKTVLRRWSGGMGGSFNYSTQEITSDSCQKNGSGNLEHEAEKKEDELKAKSSNPENVQVVLSAEVVQKEPLQGDTSAAEPFTSEVEDCTSAELNQQQEAELNEMVMKVLESSRPSKCHGSEIGNDGLMDTSIDQRGGFYCQYREKRDEKLRAENARNHAVKQEQFKVMQETLEQNKAAMASKTIKAAVKPEPAKLLQKPRRNSSPPVLLKKELSRPTGAKNGSPKLSSPKTGSALPSGPLKRKGGTPSAKTSPVVSSSSMPSRQRPHPSNSPRQPSPTSEKPLGRAKGNKSDRSLQTFAKPSMKGQEDKQLKAVAKNSKAGKPKSPLSGEDCGELSKPTVPNKHTKKSSVVPVESKPFLRKSSGISPGIGLPVAKAKDARVEKMGDSSKSSVNLIHPEENEPNTTPVVSTIKVMEDDLIQPTTVVDVTFTAPLDNDIYIETAENVDGSVTGPDNEIENSVDHFIAEVQRDEDLGISSAAWVETEHHEYSPSFNNGLHGVSPMIGPVVSSNSRVRHSLSQMLQAENGEPEIIEWGNAENPPSLVYQKDAPKGLKRLLKFARKSKGEANSTGWSSPSVFSEGEEEHEESKAASKTKEALLRKASLQTMGHEQPRSGVSESVDGGNSSKRAIDYRIVHDVSTGSLGSDKPRVGHISTGGAAAAAAAAAATTTATKATRSFFSLSSFRSSKSNAKKA